MAWRPKASAPSARVNSATAGKYRPASPSRPAAPSPWRTSHGPGAIQQMWFTVFPKFWRTLILRIVLGRRGNPVRRGPARRLLLHRLVHAHQRQLAAGRRQSGRRLQLLLGNAFPPPCPDHGRKSHSGRHRRLLLPDQLHADRGGSGSRLFPCPVPPPEPAAVQRGLYHSRRCRGPGSFCRRLHGLGCQQQPLVGRRRGQVLHRRRQRVSHHLRHRHRGLLWRRLGLRACRPANTASFHRRSPACRR